VTVDFHPQLDGDLAERAWKLYYEAFTPLAALAAQRHVMYRGEFDDVMADTRIDKVLTYDDAGELVGLATFTRDLDAVPLVSPPYFERRWPQLYAERRIWYIGFVAVAESARKSMAFLEAFRHYFAAADAVDGIIGLDVCSYNEVSFRLPQIIGANVRRLSDHTSRYERADTQSYWIYDMKGNHL
jgi:hypothetical protein